MFFRDSKIFQTQEEIKNFVLPIFYLKFYHFGYNIQMNGSIVI
ncbi:hypothetical protein LEP1GSC008_2142 [Leptospira kirschneri serovar Bulgarica str. Nikolaevo]|uniref:Uncharacterized protein n=1 Tax=Leptospira kirschneri serovar Bulgarica str. Nikolaevo TaxID=1240687 RepID=M6F7M4_9LEPT|nr:hypothetical protein LEP1GSC008_2142 [Leptospira kirschneri serovar Bulgarica str. Nikolaevo]